MSTHQENRLETSLRLAASEPAHRPEFFRTLLNSTVYVIGIAGANEGEVNLEAGNKISIMHWAKPDGLPVVPFFSSLEVLQNSISLGQTYLEIPARDLFEITAGTNVFLNPKSLIGKEFTSEEVQYLLSDGVSKKATSRAVQNNTKILLGQPVEYPTKMVDSLTQLLAKHQNVNRAFFALLHDPSVDEKPHLVVGIEADGDVELVLREAGSVAGDTSPDGEPVDLCVISEDDDGLSNYLLTQTTPFYERRWGSKLISFLGFGKVKH